MASTLATFAALLKTRYTNDKVENLTKADRPLLGLLPASEDFTGDGMVIPVIYANPQGIASANLSTAQTNTSNVAAAKFTVTTGDHFGSVSIGDKVIKASKNNAGAFIENKVAEIDGLYEQMADDLDVHLHGNGGFALGRVSSIDTTTNAIQLSETSEGVNFHQNMYLVASTADGTTGSVKTGHALVEAVDRENGIITIDDYSGIDTPTGPVANDYLFREGVFGATSGLALVKGLGAYIYSTSTSVPALFGLTRSTDPQKLAGCRVPSSVYTGKGIEERLRLLGSWMVGRYLTPGADTVLLHPENWEDLVTSLASRGTRPANDSTAKFGYMSIEAVIGGRLVKCYPDRHQPKGLAFALKLATWKLYSMGKLLSPVEADGLTILRAASSNDYEYRLVSYPALTCKAPGYNGRIPV